MGLKATSLKIKKCGGVELVRNKPDLCSLFLSLLEATLAATSTTHPNFPPKLSVVTLHRG